MKEVYRILILRLGSAAYQYFEKRADETKWTRGQTLIVLMEEVWQLPSLPKVVQTAAPNYFRVSIPQAIKKVIEEDPSKPAEMSWGQYLASKLNIACSFSTEQDGFEGTTLNELVSPSPLLAKRQENQASSRRKRREY